VAFISANIDAVYVAFPVKASRLRSAVLGFRALGVKGFNVTTPHKTTIMKYLDRLDPDADGIGSVNTVTNKDGTLLGYNTDGDGALRAIQEVCELHGQSVVVFGAGGAAKAIAYSFGPKVGSLQILNRTFSKAKHLEGRVRKRFRADISCKRFTEPNIKESVINADIIVNASSLGMEGNAQLPVKKEWLSPRQAIFEIVYRPIETQLLKLARQVGATTVTGLDMLLHQGAYSFELWTGKKAPICKMRQAVLEYLKASSHAKS